MSKLRGYPRGEAFPPCGHLNTRTVADDQMRGQPERVAECTSINFDGMIAMMDPDGSWVAKWQRISKQASRPEG